MQDSNITYEYDDTLHLLGEDYPARFAAVDATLDPAAVRTVAHKVIGAYRTLLLSPSVQEECELAGVVPLRLIRETVFNEPRELFDAAIRFLDQANGEVEDFPYVEASEMDHPTAADMAAAVFFTPPGNESYFTTQIGLNDED
jgi:hypothetical protein